MTATRPNRIADHRPTNLGDCCRALTADFRAAGIESPERDASLLVAAALGKEQAWLVGHREDAATPDQLALIARYRSERLDRRPVSRILGARSFWNDRFMISAATLDPRPDTETLVEAALEAINAAGQRQSPLRILDLGTGSGCILLSLLRELPAAAGVGIDINAEALAVAATNAQSLGLSGRARFIQADWLAGVAGTFDVVVGNPPYIATGEIAHLAPEVARFEPRGALDGGTDGLDAYRAIGRGLGAHIHPGSHVLLEVGQGQSPAVATLMRKTCKILKNMNITYIRDMAGHVRVVAWCGRSSTVS